MRTALLIASTLLFATCAKAAEPLECPLVRPPGLSAANVESIVIRTLAKVLKVSPQALAKSKSFEQTDSTDESGTHFAFFIVWTGEELGIDTAAVFQSVADARHEGKIEALTLGEYVEAAQQEYLRGEDGPPPPVREGARYQVGRGFVIAAPSPARGWRVAKCRVNSIHFVRNEDDGITAYLVERGAMPPFTNVAALESFVREQIAAVQHATELVDVQLTRPATPNPCVDFRYRAPADNLAMVGRSCYDNARSTAAVTAYFTRKGGWKPQADLAEAKALVEAATMERPN